MKNLLIIGARGLGREIFCLAVRTKEYETVFTIKGFLDDKSDALDGLEGYPPIISSVEDYDIHPDDVFICALGDPFYRKKYVEIVETKGGKFITIIAPTANISKNSQIGIGCAIFDFVSISCDTRIGNHTDILNHSTLGHDSKVGDFCQLSAYSFLGGYASVEKETTLYTGTIILPHITVKNNCTIGAGAVVIKNIKSNTTVYGNPARELKI